MKTALICVDVQYDFLPGGSLGVPDGEKVILPLRVAADEADLVIASGDLHPPGHISFTTHGGEFIPHCIKGTKGARIHPQIRKIAEVTVWKGTEPDQEAFSAFAGSTLRPKRTLPEVLKDEGFEKGDRVLVGGLVMEICVKHTALDAAASGFQTIVLLDATRPLSVLGEAEALESFRKADVAVQSILGS